MPEKRRFKTMGCALARRLCRTRKMPAQGAIGKWIGKLAVALALAGAGPASADDPGYYVQLPYSMPGKPALDLRFWSEKAPGQSTMMWPEIGLRYGVSSRWTTELLASFIGPTLGRQNFSTLNWQNTYLLTQGQYPFDLAVYANLIRNREGEHALELGPLLQTEVGLTQLNFNLLFARDWGEGEGTELKYQWQVLHRFGRGVRAGVQGFGELGRWNHWSETSHRAGPVVRLGLTDGLDLQAAYLWGKVYGSRNDIFSAQLLWSF